MHVGYAMPFRDGKGSTWEGGHRVPGIFNWPGMISLNTIIRNPISTLDIFPTLARIAGAKMTTDRSIDGRDVSPLLFASNAPVPAFEFLYSYNDNQQSAIRVGPWKLHCRLGSQLGHNHGFSASYESPLLFQLENAYL